VSRLQEVVLTLVATVLLLGVLAFGVLRLYA
jgi:hypothetical protein